MLSFDISFVAIATASLALLSSVSNCYQYTVIEFVVYSNNPIIYDYIYYNGVLLKLAHL